MKSISDDDIRPFLEFFSARLSCLVAPEGLESPELAKSKSANLIRTIISLFSVAVMEHHPRDFPRVRAHLRKSLLTSYVIGQFPFQIMSGIAIPLKPSYFKILQVAGVLLPGKCKICPHEILS